jgi:hypothetical protein
MYAIVHDNGSTGFGSVSGLANGRDVKEGDRDPVTGRLILDPLKIPTADQV